MSPHAIDLYERIPLIYRLRDAEKGYPLKALLEVIADQADVLKGDLDGLYDNLFIETCRDWVVPYIGDLVGNRTLHEIVRGRRADVAKTISYRRRKGVLPMLEELSRDVTDWKAHASQAFELVVWSQNVNHMRSESTPNPEKTDPNAVSFVGTVNVRDMDALDRLDGPFDVLSHSADVRPACRVTGWQNIRKANFFLWRLENFKLEGAPAEPSTSHAGGFYFSVLGCPAPLFTDPEREDAPDKLATEVHVPGPIRPAAFYFAPEDYYGKDKSLAIYRGEKADPEQMVPIEQILVGDLSAWSSPAAGKVAVDPRTGRISFAAGEAPAAVTVTYNCGFAAKIGGGPYDRRKTLTKPGSSTKVIEVSKAGTIDTLQDAIHKWEITGRPPCIIQILDNGIYGGQFDVLLPADGDLRIEAENGKRPTCRTVGNVTVEGPADSHFSMNGILIEGSIRLKGDLDFQLRHCTMVPGRLLTEAGLPFNPDLDSLRTLSSNDWPTATVDSCIVGPIRLPEGCPGLTLRDSIVDAPSVAHAEQPAIAADDAADEPGPPTTIERCTVWGELYVKQLEASETIFNQRVRVEQLQGGCMRFCWLPLSSETPRRYECQPVLALQKEALRLGRAAVDELTAAESAAVLARVRPTYTSIHYGDPSYAQLGHHCPAEISQGAEDGSEMGVFCSLKQPQREANLRLRLKEYLPFGLEPGLIFTT
jgi:hypothetical protein